MRRNSGYFLRNNQHNVYPLQVSLYQLMLAAQLNPTAGGTIMWPPDGDSPTKIIPTVGYRVRLRKLLRLVLWSGCALLADWLYVGAGLSASTQILS